MNRSNLVGALASAVVTILASGAGVEAATPTNSKAAAWYQAGATVVAANERVNPNERKAKNVILFVGDGMGISTVTAARILEGQLRGKLGEENVLSFERLPYMALSKTYSANQQTSDSAPTATAMVAGIKTNDGAISVDEDTARNEADAAVIAQPLGADDSRAGRSEGPVHGDRHDGPRHACDAGGELCAHR